MKITIISATDRPKARAYQIAEYLKPRYEQQGAEVTILDLIDFPIQSVAGGKYDSEIPDVKKFRKPVLEADGLIFIIPEYNGSYPGILKLFVDYLPFPEAFKGMPMAFIGESKGIFGGMRAVEQFQMVANYRNALQFPERVFIPKVHEEFYPETGLKDAFKQGLLDSQIKNFVSFIKAFRE